MWVVLSGEDSKIDTGSQAGTAYERRSPRVRTISVTEQIIDQLGLEIVNGERRPGERLGEEDLADYFGVSRAPVREATRVLEKRGLVSVYPRRGAFVKALSIKSIRDVIEVRSALFGYAARECAVAQEPAFLELLSANIAAMRELARDPATEPRTFAFMTREKFYAELARHSGNSHLPRALADNAEYSIWPFIWQHYEVEFLTVERRLEFVVESEAVLDAIRSGDLMQAEMLIRRMFSKTLDAALDKLCETLAHLIDEQGRGAVPAQGR